MGKLNLDEDLNKFVDNNVEQSWKEYQRLQKEKKRKQKEKKKIIKSRNCNCSDLG